MTLQNHVVSYELAIKLKVLALKQESCFYWTDQAAHGKNLVLMPYEDAHERCEGNKYTAWVDLESTCSAYLTTELLKILPYYQKFGINRHLLKIIKATSRGLYKVAYGKEISGWDENLTDNLGEMIIYLIENKMWSPND